MMQTTTLSKILSFGLLTACLFALGCNSDDGNPNGGASSVPGVLAFDKYILDADAGGPAFAELADLNGDGRTDILVSRFGTVDRSTFEIPSGEVTAFLQGPTIDQWSKVPVITEAEGIVWPNEISLKDIDDDGDLDIFVPGGFLVCGVIPGSSPCGSLQWFENQNMTFVRHNIIEFGAELFYHYAAIDDLDGDGIKDLLTVGETRPAPGNGEDDAQAMWFKGTLDADRFEKQPRMIGRGLGSLPTILDIDGDGDLDVASAEYFAGLGGSFAWFENVAAPSASNPAGTWQRHVIDDTAGPSIQLTFIPNFLGDGRLVAVGSNHTNTSKEPADIWESAVYAYVIPEDPKTAWPRLKLSEGIVSVAGLPSSPQAAPGIFGYGDAEGDGDIDLIVSGDGDPNVYLIEQTAAGQFQTWIFDEDIPQAGGMRIHDLDGDGTAEIIATGYENNAIYLYRRSATGAHPIAPVSTLPQGTTAPANTGSTEPTNDVVLNVNYTGALNGNLVSAIFPGPSPSSPPVVFNQVENATFPQQVVFEGLEPGEYTAVTFLDVAPIDPTAPGAEDPVTMSSVNIPNTAGPITMDLVDVGAAPAAGAPGDIRLIIDYDGPERGDVIVAAFPSLPPMGPPLKYKAVPGVTEFPIEVTLEAVPAGDVQVAVYLDLPPLNPAMWGDEDPAVETMVITMDQNPVELEVSLTQ